MNYTSSVQNTSQSVYTPYIIKPGNGNDYVTYADLIKLGNITDFGYKDGYTSFSTWQEFIISVHEHLRDLYERLGGIVPDNVSVTGVSVYPKSNTIYVGSTQQLQATISPDNASNKSVTWSSSNISVATISSSGLVTGVSAGTANITVTTVDGNKTDDATITVEQRNPDPVNIPVTGVSISPSSISLNIGETQQLRATISPSNATNTTVTWSSSDQSIAIVSTNGLVTAKAAGTVNITVETESGGYMATCAITVSPTSQTTYYWYAGTTLPTESNINTIAKGSLTSKPSWTASNQQDCTVTNNTGASSYVYYCFPANWNVTFYDGNGFNVGLATESSFTYNNVEYKVERLGRKQVAGATIPLFARC